MKRLARILIIASVFALTVAPAVPQSFDDPPPCDPRDPKCKPPIPPLE